MKNLFISELLDFYGPMLTEKQRSLAADYYDNDLSLAEIAENEGISRQGVCDTLKRAETQLYEMEKKLGLYERRRQVALAAEKIRAADDGRLKNEIDLLFKYI